MNDYIVVVENDKFIVRVADIKETILSYEHYYPNEIVITIEEIYQPIELNTHGFLDKEIYDRLPIALKKRNVSLDQDLIKEFIDNIQKMRIKEFLKEYISKNHISEDRILSLIEEIDDERVETEGHR